MPAEFFGYYVITALLALAGYILFFALTEKRGVTRESENIAGPQPAETATPALRRAA